MISLLVTFADFLESAFSSFLSFLPAAFLVFGFGFQRRHRDWAVLPVEGNIRKEARARVPNFPGQGILSFDADANFH